jgi:hypothetical protein
MNKDIPYFYINAYPRSGSKFFQTALLNYFNLDQNYNYMKKTETNHQLNLFFDKNKIIITIIRNPKDCIVSACSMSYELGMISEYEIDGYLDREILNWTRYMDNTMFNLSKLYPFMFDQVVDNVGLCLDKIAITFSLNRNNVDSKTVYELYKTFYSGMKESSKNSKKYNMILEKYEKINNSEKDNLDVAYKEYKHKVSSRQESLGWHF